GRDLHSSGGAPWVVGGASSDIRRVRRLRKMRKNSCTSLNVVAGSWLKSVKGEPYLLADMRSIVTRASWVAALRSATFPLTSSAAFASAQYSVKAAAPAGQSSVSLVFHFFRESRISAARWTLRRSAAVTGVLIGGIVAAGWPDGDCGRKAGARVKATA